MLKTTPLLEQHQHAGAKLVDFSGWQMPLHYGSQLEEHHTVRQDVGVFDVSHMAIIDITGDKVFDFLRYLLANDIAKLNVKGKALYTCMLNFEGGVIDDLIVYKINDCHYRLVLNAGTREKDWQWLQTQHKSFCVNLEQRNDMGILAVQGPNAFSKILSLLTPKERDIVAKLQPFHAVFIRERFYSRTGYTGEDGLEIHIPNSEIKTVWEEFLAAGIKPCGLGARDTLRLEAGLNLYGVDMDETTTPLESNLTWTVAFEPKDRNFIGRDSLERQLQHGHKQMVGLILETPGVLRSHQKVLIAENGIGEITSGTFSPTLGHSIALARLPAINSISHCDVEIRQKIIPVQIVQPPFVRRGKKVYKGISQLA